MTARQTRTQRRAAERAARKQERKAANGFVFSTPGTTPSQISESPLQSAERSDGSGPIPPISPSQLAANRANAAHSTGPRTPTGKLASSRNSLKHGLASPQLIIPGENRADFDMLLADLLAEHQPACPTEELLVHQIAQSWWLTQRALRFQNECFAAEDVDEKRLSLFLRYQTTHERAFHKALNTLMLMKKDRALGFVSQNPASDPPTTQFVSQNEPPEIRLAGRTA
jgi:hypothetical protein